MASGLTRDWSRSFAVAMPLVGWPASLGTATVVSYILPDDVTGSLSLFFDPSYLETRTLCLQIFPFPFHFHFHNAVVSVHTRADLELLVHH